MWPFSAVAAPLPQTTAPTSASAPTSAASTAGNSAEMSSTPVVDWAAKLDALKKAASERLSA